MKMTNALAHFAPACRSPVARRPPSLEFMHCCVDVGLGPAREVIDRDVEAARFSFSPIKPGYISVLIFQIARREDRSLGRSESNPGRSRIRMVAQCLVPRDVRGRARLSVSAHIQPHS
jgi:hypothetical protein